MLVTTLLSCRLLEPIAIAKLQAIAFFIARCCRIVWKQSSQVRESSPARSQTMIALIFSVTIPRRLWSNAAIHLATANATNGES